MTGGDGKGRGAPEREGEVVLVVGVARPDQLSHFRSSTLQLPVSGTAGLGQAPVVDKVCFLTEEPLSSRKLLRGGAPVDQGSTAGGHVTGRAGGGTLSLPSSGSCSPPFLQPGNMAWPALSSGLEDRRQPGREAQPSTTTSLGTPLSQALAEMSNRPHALLGPRVILSLGCLAWLQMPQGKKKA